MEITGKHSRVARAGLRLKREELSVKAKAPTYLVALFENGSPGVPDWMGARLAAALVDLGAAFVVSYGGENSVQAPAGAPDGAVWRMARAALGVSMRELSQRGDAAAYETLIRLEGGSPVRRSSVTHMAKLYQRFGIYVDEQALKVQWKGE